MAVDLRDLGIRRVADLKGRDPERMYRRLIQLRGQHQDRCVLYVFRCAVYFASTRSPRRDLLDWWRWKDPR
jgi:pathogenicity locus Cdd1 protein